MFEDSDISRADDLLVEPKSSKSSKSIALPARVCWQNDLLQLQISAFPEYYTEDFTRSGQFWIFDLLQLETYQIRFRYQNNLPDSFRISSTNAREAETGQAIEPGPLLTSFASLYLAEPTGPLRGTLSVNGVQIETVTERVWHLPRKSLRLKFLNVFKGYYEIYKHPAPSIPVQLGIRITNNTQKPLRFNLQHLLIPEIIGTDGQVPPGGYCIRAGGTSETDLPLIGIGETAIFWLDAVIFWHWGNQFGLRIAAYEPSCFWFLQPLKLGVYQLRFTYSNQETEIVVSDLEGRDIRLEDFWIGEVSIPPVEICLVKP